MFYNLNQVCVSLHVADGAGVYTGERGRCWCHVIWCGASSISIRKVSMGVSPMSLKKNRCSRHLRPMERRAGRRSSNLANLTNKKRAAVSIKYLHHVWYCSLSSWFFFPLPARLVGVFLFRVRLQRCVNLFPQPLDLLWVWKTFRICRHNQDKCCSATAPHSQGTAAFAEPTWVEEDDGPQTAELCLVHLHVFHLGHQLRQDSAGTSANRFRSRKAPLAVDTSPFCCLPIKNGAHPSAVGAAPVNVEARRQQDAVFYCDWAMWEGGDEELIPAWINKQSDTHQTSTFLCFFKLWSLSSSLCVKCYASRGQENQFHWCGRGKRVRARVPSPARSRMTWSSRGSSEKCGILLAHSTKVKSCLSAAWQILVTGSLVWGGKHKQTNQINVLKRTVPAGAQPTRSRTGESRYHVTLQYSTLLRRAQSARGAGMRARTHHIHRLCLCLHWVFYLFKSGCSLSCWGFLRRTSPFWAPRPARHQGSCPRACPRWNCW